MVAVKTYIRVVTQGIKVAATDREVVPGTYFKVDKASHTFANLNPCVANSSRLNLTDPKVVKLAE